MKKSDIKSMPLEQLTKYILSLDMKPFVAKQVYSWLHERDIEAFSQMSNISKSAQEKFTQDAEILSVAQVEKQVSSDGTIKYLYALWDDNIIETVVMRYDHGNTICVSTQVGCAMGCTFCASTQGGKVRNLSASEILSQIYVSQRDISKRIDNVVLMGIGEPLDNFHSVIDFIKIISSREGKNISQRAISLSTCGIVDKIYELAKYNFGITLSISLHATTNANRDKSMPINKAYPIERLIKACKDYTNITKRRISFEYAMIKGVNDTEEDAVRLSRLLRGIISHVNLIPINPVDGSPYSQSDKRTIENFKDKLTQLNVNATIRRRLGQDISAACGQLRNEHR